MTPFRRDKPRELTGRAVLLWIVGFFAVVFAVNGVLVQAATSTFRGIEVGSSYQAGLMFKQEVESAERQNALHWRVDGKLSRDGTGQAVLDIGAADAQGAPVTGLTAVAYLAHPADSRLDRTVELDKIAPGRFHGAVTAQAGQWELTVDLSRGGDRLFRSRSRVTLR